MKRIVVGTGQAAPPRASAVEGFAGEILLLGDEPGFPYQRPPLSKAYMADGDGERLLLKPAGFYERSGITLADQTRVAAIDRARAEVVTEAGTCAAMTT